VEGTYPSYALTRFPARLIASAIIAVAMVGVPGDDVGKKPTAEPTTTEATTAGAAHRHLNQVLTHAANIG
jgi:hypothetical protein